MFFSMLSFPLVNKFSMYLFGITIVSSLIAIITIPGYIDCLQDSDCNNGDITDSTFQNTVSGLSIVGVMICTFYLILYIISYDEENSPNQTNQSYPKLNSEYRESLLGFSNDKESMRNQRNKPSAKSNNKYNDNSHNATCIVCKKGFKGASLARHETGRFANKIVRVGLMMPFVGIFSLLGWFDDDSYTPVCSNCCIICKLPKSNCDGHVSEDLGDDL